ncbi:extracellular solute-binding protein [Paenibacillus contaminans]|uniref:ABC transporter substrate-binding protein n=1 Tax=Paenibacillus contaminans TaxID=450362 RepID=A0A329MHY9_9BACL|nr:extracellular solute-binding protein [Paenibacillus contaminans]RAV18986.1 ABC transporter substrate-binding protein [Paenibacillus contaminans]
MKTTCKRAATPLISLTLALAVTACGGTSNENKGEPAKSASPSPASKQAAVYPENGLPKDEKVTLKFGFFEGGSGREWFDYAMETFKKKFPNVSFEVVYSPKIGDLVNTKIAANNDDDMFDMFNGPPAGFNDTAVNLIKEGRLESQEDLWDRKTYDGSGKTLKELALEGQYKGAARILDKTYALPMNGTGTGLFFNKKLFEQNGWNQNPRTWDEFLKLCEDIKAKGVIPITYPGTVIGYLDYAFTGPWKLFELAEISGNLKTIESNYRNLELPFYTSPEYIDMYNRMYELGKRGYFSPGAAGLNHTQSQMQVLQGKAAMVTTGVWVSNEMKDSMPKDFEWGFMVVPYGDKPDSTKWMRVSAGGGAYIWGKKPELNRKWAKEFNVWLWNLDVQQAFAEKGGQLPIRSDYMDDQARAEKLQDAPRAMLQYMKTNKVMGETGSFAVTLSAPERAQADKLLNDNRGLIAEGKKDPKDVLQEVELFMKKAIDSKKK